MSNNSLPSFEQFAATRRNGGNNGFGMAWSPDSKWLAYATNISGQFNLWKQPARGGYPVQLTFYADRAVRLMAWSPDGSTLLYMADLNGDEYHQLFSVPACGGTATQLTDVPDAINRISPGAWSPDGSRIAYASNADDRRYVSVYVRDMQSGETQKLIDEPANHFPGAWSPDGRYLLASKQNGNVDTDIVLIDMGTGMARNLTRHEGQVVFAPSAWSREKGKNGFYFISNEAGEFFSLGFYNLDTDKRTWVQSPDWDVEAAGVSRDGRLLAWSVNEDGLSRLRLLNLKKGKKLKLPSMLSGVIHYMAFSPDSRKLALLMGGATLCTQPFVLSLKKKKLRQVTQSMLGGIDAQMVDPELVHYETFDGKQVPAWLYKPREAKGRIPVVLSVHGGPEAQERPDYSYVAYMYQYWLSRGIGVLATNIRGSTGYGKSYQKLIRRDWGGGDLKDMEHAVTYLHTLDWVDPQNIGFFGGSYGGYACLSVVSRLPELFSVAVGWFGPSNLVSFARSVPPYWKSFIKDWVGDPDEDRDLLVERSPLTYVDNVKTPLFIVQGALDPRVVQAESDQFVDKLRERGVPVRYDVYPDEGHGFTKRSNELKALKDSAEFLEQRLIG
jgi:dipeptidyl aminopeptidase/acylaminoacyl peptidase